MPIQVKSPEDLKERFKEKEEQVGDMAQEMAKREWELFEFNLFLSASGKNHLEKSEEKVKLLRKDLWKKAKEIAANETEALDKYEEAISD